MKIVARTGSSYLAEISEIEICKLMGFDSLYSDGWEEVKRTYRKESDQRYNAQLMLEGCEIDITKVSDRAATMRQNEAKITSAIETFRGMADALESAWPALKRITSEEKTNDR